MFLFVKDLSIIYTKNVSWFWKHVNDIVSDGWNMYRRQWYKTHILQYYIKI